jgi:hypothetical protein
MIKIEYPKVSLSELISALITLLAILRADPVLRDRAIVRHSGDLLTPMQDSVKAPLWPSMPQAYQTSMLRVIGGIDQHLLDAQGEIVPAAVERLHAAGFNVKWSLRRPGAESPNVVVRLTQAGVLEDQMLITNQRLTPA